MDERLLDELIALLPRLRRFARGLVGTSEDADDLVQAACERAISRIHQWQSGTRFDSWLYRIIQTIHIDQQRAKRVRAGYAETVASTGITSIDGQRFADARLTLAQVRRCVDLLPDEQRSVLLLVCVEGFSYKEAADIIGVPMGTIMSRLARARMALGKRLDGSATGAQWDTATG